MNSVKLLILICATVKSLSANYLELSVIHINDFHAKYEEITIDSGLCKTNNCIGGFSRLYAASKDLIRSRPNPIFLNAGDNFEGSLWYTVYKWNVTQHFLNKLPIDAYTLGNHEFEDKIEGLVPFLQHLKAPIVVSNIDICNEPRLKDLFKKSIVIKRGGVKIGLIGVILSTINKIADTGNLLFLDESMSVNKEAERLVTEEGVFTNIIISHCGYYKDIEIANKVTLKSKISLIVGGHSHSLLYTETPLPGPDLPEGPYPTVIDRKLQKILVVQASSYSKYIGNISVFYNDRGHVTSWDGAPIFLDTHFAQDEKINIELELWKQKVNEQPNEIIGSTLVRLDQNKCPTAECLMGNFLTDAMVYANTGSNASFAVIHAAGIRAGIDVGNITYYDVYLAQPFKNTIDTAEITGEHLMKVLEDSVRNGVNLLQVSGMRIVYNMTKSVGNRIQLVEICCQNSLKYEPLDLHKTYKIILLSFLAEGGFGFDLFKDYLRNRQIGDLDTNVFLKFITEKSPIFLQKEGRVHLFL